MDSERTDSGLESLLIVSRFYGIPADASQLKHRFAQPGLLFSSQDLVRAAKHLGLKAKITQSTPDKLESFHFPLLARNKGDQYLVLLSLKEGKLLIKDQISKKIFSQTLGEFSEAWSGELILFTRRAADPSTGSTRFGLSWFWPAIKKYRKPLLQVLVFSFFLQLFALVTPLFFQAIVDKVLLHNSLGTLHVIGIAWIAMTLFDAVLGGLRQYGLAHTSNRIDVELGARVYRHLLALPLSYFEARRVGDSVARVRELESIRNFLTSSSLTLVVDIFFTFVFFAVLFYYSPLLTGIVVAAVFAYVFLSISVTGTLRARLDEKFNRGAENQAFLVETITGMETVKAMSVEPRMQTRWEDQLAAYVGASFRAGNLSNIAGQLAGFINKISVVGILWLGATLVMAGELSVGQLIAFNMIAARVFSPILRLVQLWQDFQQAGISIKRLGDILNMPTEPGYQNVRGSLPAIAGKVTMENVSFRYRPDSPTVLENISLAFDAGEVIGIAGHSGSGKSTITKLLLRMYSPEKGRVLLDGSDISLADPSWLRSQVGVVPQESFLFNRTIRENIALSDPALPLEKIIAAAKLAGAHEFIMAQPEGYDQVVGERGSNLSGGQKQRIAIARALAVDPRILIFDEATSALDYESERAVQENMRAICQGRTVIIVAHRLSTLRECDRIVVMENGRVEETGSHQELLKNKGIYARMHQLQRGVPVNQPQPLMQNWLTAK